MGFFNFSKPERNDEQQSTTEQREPREQRQWEHREPRAPRAPREESGADEVFSVPVKAGKRIYYFDVKSTRADDYYVTITESRKKPTRDGGFTIEKHKIHLYKEDFAKFAEGLEQVVAYVNEHRPEAEEQEQPEQDQLDSTPAGDEVL